MQSAILPQAFPNIRSKSPEVPITAVFACGTRFLPHFARMPHEKRVAERLGFVLRRQRGSHAIYVRMSDQARL